MENLEDMNLENSEDMNMENNTILYYSDLAKPIILKDIINLSSTDINKYCSKRKLINIILGKSVVVLQDNCFHHCVNLKNINIPGNVIKIEKNCFSSCYSLETITLNEGTKELDDYCIKGCFNITEITFPKTLEKIGNNCFQSCLKLRNLLFKDPQNFINCGIDIFKNINKTLTMTFNNTENYFMLNENIIQLTKYNFENPKITSSFYRYKR